MGAYFSLEVARLGVEILFSNYILDVILPNKQGACPLLPKVMHQLEELEFRKDADGQDFPGSNLSFSAQQRSKWMTEISKVRPIGQIIWPGTNYSATNQIGTRFITRPYGERQTLSIYRQLRQGVRALDIRIQHKGLVCSGNISSGTTSIHHVIGDIKTFLAETQSEIIFLEIRTETGYSDPPNFEAYLVNQLGDLLIHQSLKVFSKTIVEVLPRRIICVWKPNYSPVPQAGGPIWSSKYLEGDEIVTQMPLTKFEGNINKLKDRAADLNVDNCTFYKVEYTMAPRATSLMEWLLVWPKYAKVVSKRINDFARLFLAKCNVEGVLHRLQILSVDFVDVDFISACIALNYTLQLQSCQLTVPARDLYIVWGDDIRYWQWSSVSSDERDGRIDVAELLDVCWLEVSGKVDMASLSACTKYEVAYVVKLKTSSYGMKKINFSLTLPDGNKIEHTENLDDKPRETWLSISVGRFTTPPQKKGAIQFSLYEYVNLGWKSGLIVKGVVIKARNHSPSTGTPL